MAKRKPKKKRSCPVRPRKDKAVEYDYHLPVMLAETLEYLITDPDGVYVDGTLGGGGHTAVILDRLSPKGHLHSFDKDDAAIKHCSEKFWGEFHSADSPSRLTLHNMSFEGACSIEEIKEPINGILLDLGVSSRQLDDSRRGFSYRGNSELDMRFSSHGYSAKELLNKAKEEELERILRDYGEEPFARKLARRISQRRRAFPLQTTYDLRLVVEETVPAHLRYKCLSRVFQAFRIAVNDELNILEQTLLGIVPRLAPGGRIVVISYHSLEDRIVKNVFRQFSHSNSKELSRSDDIKANDVPKMETLTPKPILPGPDEIERNPRARSAKVRVAAKVLNDK